MNHLIIIITPFEATEKSTYNTSECKNKKEKGKKNPNADPDPGPRRYDIDIKPPVLDFGIFCSKIKVKYYQFLEQLLSYYKDRQESNSILIDRESVEHYLELIDFEFESEASVGNERRLPLLELGERKLIIDFSKDDYIMISSSEIEGRLTLENSVINRTNEYQCGSESQDSVCRDEFNNVYNYILTQLSRIYPCNSIEIQNIIRDNQKDVIISKAIFVIPFTDCKLQIELYEQRKEITILINIKRNNIPIAI